MGYRTFKFKVCHGKRNRHLHQQIESFASPYNHLLAVRQRYYRIYKQSPSKSALQRHLTKLKKTKRFGWWRELPSQALQNVVERISFGFDKFFRGENKRPPKFRARFKYKSFTLKQSGYKFLADDKIRIGARVFRYWKHRAFDPDTVKQVVVKRDRVGNIWLCIVAKGEPVKVDPIKTGQTAGVDFGLKTYLTLSDGTTYESPLFFKRNARSVKRANRALSRKKKDSKNRVRARLALARVHRKVANQRENFHWQLANALVKRYDALCFETLNIAVMKHLWGRKVSDLGFSDFLLKLKWVFAKHGKLLVQIDRFEPTSKTCSACGTVKEMLSLRERVFNCECGFEGDRDLNAAINIHRVGASTLAGEAIRRSAA